MSDVILRADGGEITVGRQIGSFVWGRWDVTLPSDVSLKTQPDTRMAEGFLYKPEDLPKGRFDLRGVRADSSQTMVAKKSGEIDYSLSTSDTEQVLDAAEKRIEGNLFFEKDITTDGLGIYEPGVDFHEDDLVDVMLWGKRLPDLPVTAIDITSERGSAEKWRVHVGGQPIADAAALRSSREKIFAQIAAERREAASKLGAVSQQAASAGTAAAQADNKAAAAQETADDALAKWRQQKDQLDKVQSAQIEANAKINDAQQRAIELGFLFNHGEWVMSKEWKANAGESKVMDFDTALSTPRGCESTAITSNGETVGHGIRFLSPGFWRLYARVLIPWVGLVQASAVHVSIVVMGKNGKSIATSKYALVVDTAPSTASFPMTVEIPEAGCYAYVEVNTSKALNQSIVPGTFVSLGNNEFSAQQISKIF
ncbi:hypothetical protein [Corynebacterium diphtheriae]|uniref:hypothetical protein n=1 Tax=Corynebacterium diphtheriae TaxID=1717 RepID=UPI00086AA32E|nr:hypothetical protein [Corynebacterium diphtheriae]MBG9295072.1 hypothetical protein [Corynebacterium diphtheriae bv. mitis]MBG9316422.1 hypothetical protein [Corynebacterium diphtheriae bv. mitis]MBG9335663.1 hypothetical protein [Corynebacterium diphtheriae bv. gravis]ODS17689.1 hypothetical protein BGK43_02315 [Corynebacterium diphtheriae]ONF69063.1 hypothetical protein BXA20_00005 [Corynebacterium diphtheriae]